MADIELVIKIPEKAYNALTHTKFDANLVVDEMRKSIANGTPLPKGHGRLIDANEVCKLEKELCVTECGCCALDGCFYDRATTIIEADTESEEV